MGSGPDAPEARANNEGTLRMTLDDIRKAAREMQATILKLGDHL